MWWICIAVAAGGCFVRNHAPEGCLLKERCGTDCIMQTQREADQITGHLHLRLKNSQLHAHLVLMFSMPILHSVLWSHSFCLQDEDLNVKHLSFHKHVFPHSIMFDYYLLWKHGEQASPPDNLVLSPSLVRSDVVTLCSDNFLQWFRFSNAENRCRISKNTFF